MCYHSHECCIFKRPPRRERCSTRREESLMAEPGAPRDRSGSLDAFPVAETTLEAASPRRRTSVRKGGGEDIGEEWGRGGAGDREAQKKTPGVSGRQATCCPLVSLGGCGMLAPRPSATKHFWDRASHRPFSGFHEADVQPGLRTPALTR